MFHLGSEECIIFSPTIRANLYIYDPEEEIGPKKMSFKVKELIVVYNETCKAGLIIKDISFSRSNLIL